MTQPVMDVVQYAKLWVWKVTLESCCRTQSCGSVIWSSEYSAVHNAMGLRHDLEAMLWFAMLWVQDVAKWM